jgi:hypothetical protein
MDLTWLSAAGFDMPSYAAILALLNLACGSLGLFLLKQQERPRAAIPAASNCLPTLHLKAREHE